MTHRTLEQFDAKMASDMTQDIRRLIRRVLARKAHVLVRPRQTRALFGVNVDRLHVDGQVFEAVVALDAIPSGRQVAIDAYQTVGV